MPLVGELETLGRGKVYLACLTQLLHDLKNGMPLEGGMLTLNSRRLYELFDAIVTHLGREGRGDWRQLAIEAGTTAKEIAAGRRELSPGHKRDWEAVFQEAQAWAQRVADCLRSSSAEPETRK
jgi:hypothetical protein